MNDKNHSTMMTVREIATTMAFDLVNDTFYDPCERAEELILYQPMEYEKAKRIIEEVDPRLERLQEYVDEMEKAPENIEEYAKWLLLYEVIKEIDYYTRKLWW